MENMQGDLRGTTKRPSQEKEDLQEYGTCDANQVSVRDVRGGRTQRSWHSEKYGGAVFVLGRDVGGTWCPLGRQFHLRHSR